MVRGIAVPLLLLGRHLRGIGQKGSRLEYIVLFNRLLQCPLASEIVVRVHMWSSLVVKGILHLLRTQGLEHCTNVVVRLPLGSAVGYGNRAAH